MSARTYVMGSICVGLLSGACGGSSKGTTTPSQVAGAKESGIDDLHIPRVDPTLCDTKGKTVETFDLNQDGKPDVWKLSVERDVKGTKDKLFTCEQADLNFDGKKDYVAEYDE